VTELADALRWDGHPECLKSQINGKNQEWVKEVVKDLEWICAELLSW
jgi:hypothetical protein